MKRSQRLVYFGFVGWIGLLAQGAFCQEVSPCRFELRLAAPAATAPVGEIVLTPVGQSGASLVPRTLAVRNGRIESAESLPTGSRWKVTGRLSGFWLRPVEISAGGPLALLKIWPLATVRGKVLFSTPSPSGAKPPTALFVTTLPLRANSLDRDAPKAQVECPLAKDGTFECELAAATYDLSLFAEGFIPEYRWGISLRATLPKDLGTIKLRQGASVAGWVVGGEVELKPSDCRIKLTRWQAGLMDHRAQEIERSKARETRPNERGFFQLAGIEPGSYAIQVIQKGASPVTRGPIKVEPLAEAYLPEPFALEALLDLSWLIEPPLDWQDKAWTLSLSRRIDAASPQTEDIFEGKVGADGRVTIPAQPRGIYSLRIGDSSGQRMYSEEQILIAATSEAARTVSISWVEVEGDVTLGKDPVSAELWFGGHHGAVAAQAQSDSEGRYRVVLPRTGNWTLEIEVTNPPLSVEQTHFVKQAASGATRLDIAIPNTRVYGRVLDENDQPLVGAEVSLESRTGSQQVAASDAKGAFELRGAPEGETLLGASVAANTRERQSEIQSVNLEEGVSIGPVELKVRGGKKVEGRITLAGVGVEGAPIFVSAWGPMTWRHGKTETMENGKFSLTVPEGTYTATAVVGVVGGALTGFAFHVERPAELAVASAGGTLEILLSETQQEASAGRFVVFQNGVELPIQALYNWTTSQGEPFSIASQRLFRAVNVAPGEYHICYLPWSAAWEDAKKGSPPAPRSSCVKGQLVSGRVLRLEVRN